MSEREIVITRQFAAPRQKVFDALTQAKHLVRWMQPSNMSLVECEVDLRVGGSFRYVFARPGGRRLEVRGAYRKVDAPHGFAYTESYDFSPLQIQVTMELEGETLFRQTLVYATKEERDADLDGVTSSAAEVYGNLERYLSQ